MRIKGLVAAFYQEGKLGQTEELGGLLYWQLEIGGLLAKGKESWNLRADAYWLWNLPKVDSLILRLFFPNSKTVWQNQCALPREWPGIQEKADLGKVLWEKIIFQGEKKFEPVEVTYLEDLISD